MHTDVQARIAVDHTRAEDLFRLPNFVADSRPLAQCVAQHLRVLLL
jgi:hypothetical protein